MEIIALGAARQVGRSAFLVKSRDKGILLDFGVQMGREPSFPLHVQPKEVQAVILSHAHLDHSGAAPMQFLNKEMEMHTTSVTTELTQLLIEDFLKLSGRYLTYEHMDLISMVKRTTNHPYQEPFSVGEFTITFFDAGHIPGSASMIIEADGKRLLYTGDVNGEGSNLLNGAYTNFGELDAVITESTYATANHPTREEVEEDFVGYAREIVENGGILLVPAFAVGRAQEIACVLERANFQFPIAMDGMALKTNEILFRHKEFLKDPTLYKRAIEQCELVTGWQQRRAVIRTPSVIIAPAGMLVGGSAAFYMGEIAGNPKNGVAIVAFQVPGTPGRSLLDKGLAIIDGKPRRVKAQVRRFDFSSHSGRNHLLEMFRSIKGNPKVLPVHGESEACIALADEMKNTFGFEAEAPEPGARFIV